MQVMYIINYVKNGEIRHRVKKIYQDASRKIHPEGVAGDDEAIAFAKDFVKKKNGEIHFLRKVETRYIDLISID